jgi:hypothetical protein
MLPSTFHALAVEISDHAHDQWTARMPAGSVSASDALARSITVPDEALQLFQVGWHPTPDSIRLYRGCVDGEVYGAVFVVQNLPDPVVRTVYRIESRRQQAVRAYCWALLNEIDRAGDGL